MTVTKHYCDKCNKEVHWLFSLKIDSAYGTDFYEFCADCIDQIRAELRICKDAPAKT